MAWMKTTAAVSVIALAATAADAQQKQVVTGPTATYWMSAQTMSGFGAGMGTPGAKPSMSQIMAMANGGGGANKTLILQLGSSRRPTGEPTAEHLPPQGLRAGASLPLLTPRAQPVQRTEETPTFSRDYQKPKGRMLIFWGCGEHARPGQPVVIDFAKMADGKMPPGLEAMSRGLNVTPMQPPSPSRNATYGEWPNEKTRTSVPGNGSLVGEHLIRGTYSPDIRFSLNVGQDFLGPLNLTTNAIGASGAGKLGWGPVAGAQAYLATAIGGGQNDTVVLWTSSEVQASAFSLPDYLSNGDISRLVASRALMGPQTTACTIPQEVVKVAPQAMVQLAAYGNEANLSYPERPKDPKVAWNIEWTVKVRYKSQTGGLLGMEMPGARQQGQRPIMVPGGEETAPPTPAEAIGGALLRGLGGRIPRF